MSSHYRATHRPHSHSYSHTSSSGYQSHSSSSSTQKKLVGLAPPAHVPLPINTTSLKKESGVNDITSFLVRGGGKKICWGSAVSKSDEKDNTNTATATTTTAAVTSLRSRSSASSQINSTNASGNGGSSEEKDVKNINGSIREGGTDSDNHHEVGGETDNPPTSTFTSSSSSSSPPPTAAKSKSYPLDPTPEESEYDRERRQHQNSSDDHYYKEGERERGGRYGYDHGGRYGYQYDRRDRDGERGFERDRGDYGRYSHAPYRDRDRDRDRPFHGSFSRNDRYYPMEERERERRHPNSHSQLYDPYRRHDSPGGEGGGYDFDRRERRFPPQPQHSHQYRHPSDYDRDRDREADYHYPPHGQHHRYGGSRYNADYDRGAGDRDRDRDRRGGGGFERINHDYGNDYEGGYPAGRDRDRDADHDRGRFSDYHRGDSRGHWNGHGHSYYDNGGDYNRRRSDYAIGDKHNWRGRSSEEHSDLDYNRDSTKEEHGQGHEKQSIGNAERNIVEESGIGRSNTHDSEKEARREERFRQRFGKSREYHHEETDVHRNHSNDNEKEARREERFHQRFGKSREYHHDDNENHRTSIDHAENGKQAESKREDRFHQRFGKSREYHHAQTATETNNLPVHEKSKANHDPNWRLQKDHNTIHPTSDQRFRVASTLDQVKEEPMVHEPKTIMKRPVGASSDTSSSVLGPHLTSSMPSIQEASSHQLETPIEEKVAKSSGNGASHDLQNNSVLADNALSQNAESNVAPKENLRGLTVEEQQQNILRQVQATRAERTKHEMGARNNTIQNDNRFKDIKQKASNDTNLDDEHGKLVKEEIYALRAAEREARIRHRQTRGPRTKGVLFKRLPDGSLINVDQLKRAEERELRKKRKQELKQKQKEKQKQVASKTKLVEDSKEKVIKNEPDQKEQKALSTSSKDSKPVTPAKFVPAPAPAKSAWSAGPPPAIKKVQEESPTAMNQKSPGVNSNPTTSLFPHIQGESNIDDVLSCNLLDIDKTVLPSSSSWNPSSTPDQQQHEKKDKPVNIAVGPIMSSWSEFSGGTAAAVSEAFKSGVIPPHQPLSPNIGTNNVSVDEIPHRMNSFPSSPPTQHEDDSDDVIDDADFALPRDLLSGVEGEDQDESSPVSSPVPSTEVQKGSDTRHSKFNGRGRVRGRGGRGRGRGRGRGPGRGRGRGAGRGRGRGRGGRGSRSFDGKVKSKPSSN